MVYGVMSWELMVCGTGHAAKSLSTVVHISYLVDREIHLTPHRLNQTDFHQGRRQDIASSGSAKWSYTKDESNNLKVGANVPHHQDDD